MRSAWTVQCEVLGNAGVGAVELAGIASMHLFDAGALAIGEDSAVDQAGASVRLTAGFESEASAERAATLLERHMPDLTCRVVADTTHESWVESQRQSLQPTTIGPWHIRAPWHDTPPQENTALHDIVIDPGAAFGHGAHPSTRLAIELMLANVERPNVEPATVIVDLGTGTGVIAIVAAKLGHSVRASDIDPAAIEATAVNVKKNGVEQMVELTSGDAGETEVDAGDLVIANVTMDVHRTIAPSYATADHIVVSGVLCRQVAEMRDLLPGHHAAIIGTSGDWAAISFRRSLLER